MQDPLGSAHTIDDAMCMRCQIIGIAALSVRFVWLVCHATISDVAAAVLDRASILESKHGHVQPYEAEQVLRELTCIRSV